jgi:group I intron endonuclease
VDNTIKALINQTLGVIMLNTILPSESGIYAIRNTINNKVYVGQSVNIKKRIQQHFSELIDGHHHCFHLQSAFNKYGANSFENKILELCGKEIITIREQYWMDSFGSLQTYNTAKAAGSPLGIKRSKESRDKMSLAKIGLKASDETRKRMSESQNILKEIKSKKAKEQWANPDAIAHISKVRKGRITTDATRAKLSDGLLERWSNPEYKMKLSAKQKISQLKNAEIQSAMMKEKWANPEYREAMMIARRKNK